MATSLRQLIRILGTFKGEGNFAENTHTIDYTLDVTFTEGTDAGEIDRIYSDAKTTVASDSPEIIYYSGASASTTDVGYGAGVDAMGNSLVSSGLSDANICFFALQNNSVPDEYPDQVASLFSGGQDEGFQGPSTDLSVSNAHQVQVHPNGGLVGMHNSSDPGWDLNEGSYYLQGTVTFDIGLGETTYQPFSYAIVIAGRSA